MKPASTRTLWLLYAAFIVYGGTIPFHFIDLSGGASVLVDRWNRLPLSPFISPDTGRRLSIPDLVQNVLLFVPFGALGMAAARGATGWTWRRIVWVTCLGGALSITVEALQLLTRDRTASTADVMTNTAGTSAGAVAVRVAGGIALAGFQRLKAEGLADVRELKPLAVAAGALAIAFLQPFDMTLEVGSANADIKSFLANPWQFTGLRDEGIVVLIASLFAMALASYLSALDERNPAKKAAVAGIAVVGLLEGSQVLIGSRMPGLWDAAVGATGILIGAVIWAASGRLQWPRLWQFILVAMTALAVAVQMLSPFEFTSEYHGFNWFLFLGYYTRTTFETLSHVIELALAYFPMGFCLVMGAASPVRATLWALGLTLAISAPVEFMQGWVVGRYPDISDIGLSLAGAWIGCRLGRTVS